MTIFALQLSLLIYVNYTKMKMFVLNVYTFIILLFSSVIYIVIIHSWVSTSMPVYPMQVQCQLSFTNVFEGFFISLFKHHGRSQHRFFSQLKVVHDIFSHILCNTLHSTYFLPPISTVFPCLPLPVSVADIFSFLSFLSHLLILPLSLILFSLSL